MKESQKKLDDILTVEQKEKLADRKMMNSIKPFIDPVELSEEQKQKVKAAFRESQKTTGHEPTWSKRTEIILKILTPQQRIAANKHRLASYVSSTFGSIKLSEPQNKKIETLLDKICEDPDLTLTG